MDKPSTSKDISNRKLIKTIEETDLIETDLSKRRESVISFNCAKSPNSNLPYYEGFLDSPDYSGQKKSGLETGAIPKNAAKYSNKTVRSREDVNQRILETTQETKRLKKELEDLIAAGIAGSNKYNIPTPSSNVLSESLNKVQIIKSYDPKHSQHPKKPSENTVMLLAPPKIEGQAVSPKKTKNYNVHQAREYIKRQRDRRKEILENKKTNVKETVAMRKEKLKELQEKATELVKKNVDRKRSKSREPIKMPLVSENGMERSNCMEKPKKQIQPLVAQPSAYVKNPNLLFPPKLVYGIGEKIDKESIHDHNKAGLAESSKNKASETTKKKIPETTIIEQKENLGPNIKLAPTFNEKSIKSPFKQLSVNEAQFPQDLLMHVNYVPSTSSASGQVKENLQKRNSSTKSNLKIKSQDPVKNSNIGQYSNKNINIISDIIVKPEEAIKKDKITPEWLKDTVGHGDPYNFINTVKRQLKYVVNEKKPLCVDVGVQGTLKDTFMAPRNEINSNKNDLRSFISHKCLNLDPYTIKNVKLNSQELKDGPTINNLPSCSECDSDTSKNIPSISSESGTSLRRNAEIVKQSYAISDLQLLKKAPLNLDTQKVDDIKLKNSFQLTHSEIDIPKSSISNKTLPKVPMQDIERIKKNLFKESDNYTLDFISTDVSKTQGSPNALSSAKISNRMLSVSEYLKGATQESTSNTDLEMDNPKNDSKFLTRPSQESLNSNSDNNSSKKYSQSGKFYSLNSELHPSTTDDLKASNRETVEISDDDISEVKTGELQKNTSDGFTEVLKPMNNFLDHSQSGSSKCVSEKMKAGSSSEISEKSISQLTSNSEQVFTNKKENVVFSKSEPNIYNKNEHSNHVSLKQPTLSLNIENKNYVTKDVQKKALMKNISVRSGGQHYDNEDRNEIHLKFEAEIHLLNDFNESLRHFSEIEKAFESLRSKNDSEIVTKKVFQNRDTQTSIVTNTSTRRVRNQSDRSVSQISTINYSRGSGSCTDILTDQEHNTEISIRSKNSQSDNNNITDRSVEIQPDSEIMLDLTQASELKDILHSVNFEETLLGNVSRDNSSLVQYSSIYDVEMDLCDLRDENLVARNFAGMSLRMFEQLIKDEDARMENSKKMLKIREQALLDRTRGELVWLEIQKKRLIETGKAPQASMIKKKQRGILLKHQQEKHEMQRLKQMQKEASAKRKTLLKRERNLIKSQLMSDNNMLSKLKANSHRERNERRLSGPLRVIQATTSVLSEASVSEKIAEGDQEIQTITSRACSTINVVSDKSSHDIEPLELSLALSRNVSAGAIHNMKKKLLMREHALAKRRKTVEELLQWHRKLLEEEKAIEDLENKVEKIISKIPSECNEETPKSARDLSRSFSERTLSELNAPSMSEVVLDRLLPTKEKTSPKTKTVSSEASKNIPHEEITSEDSNRVLSSANYSTDFDVDTVPEALPQNSDDPSSVSSISQLIEDFSKIEGNILNLGLVQRRQSLENNENDVPIGVSENVLADTDIAEDNIQEEGKSEASSHSSQIPSEIEVKRQETVSEVIEIEVKHDSEEGKEVSVIIIEEPNENLISNSEETLKSPIEIKEFQTEESSKESSEQPLNSEIPHVSDSENVEKTSSGLKEEHTNKLLSDADLGDTSSSRALSTTHTEPSISYQQPINISQDPDLISVDNEKNVSEELPLVTTSEPSDIKTNSAAEEVVNKLVESQEAFDSTEHSLDTLEDVLASQHSGDASSSIHEEPKPSTSSKNASISSNVFDTNREHNSFIDQLTASYNALDNEIYTEQPVNLPNKQNDSIVGQLEEIEDFAAVNVDISSTLQPTEDQASSQRSTPINEAINNIEERDHYSSSSSSNHSFVENIVPSSSVIDEERQSSENKTDEEKAASLSIKAASESQRGSVSEDRLRSSDSVSRVGSSDGHEQSLGEIESVASSDTVRSLEESAPSAKLELAVKEPLLLNNASGSSNISSNEINSQHESHDCSFSKDKSKETDSIKEDILVTSNVQEHTTPSPEVLQLTLSKDSSTHESIAAEDNAGDLSSNKTFSVEQSQPDLLLDEKNWVEQNSTSISDQTAVSSKQRSPILSEEKSKSLSKKSEISSQKSSLLEQTQELQLKLSKDSPTPESIAAEDNAEVLSSNKTISVEQSPPDLLLDERNSVEDKSTTISDSTAVSSKNRSRLSSEEKSKSLSKTLETSSQKSSILEHTPKSLSVDIKKRVQEILNETSPARGDKSPRLQDLCVMTYDLISPSQSPESGSPLDANKTFSLGTEAEELLRKQLAIEQEIKLLTEQQQKEQAQAFYIREIPNKPPPPYTPPLKSKPPKTASIIPSSKEEIEQITEYSAKIIHKAYLSNNLDNISISDNTLNLIAKNIDKGCYKFVFDLCKEVAIEHYGQFTREDGPSWLQIENKSLLALSKPLDVNGLKKLMNKKLLELFGFEKFEKTKENVIMKWSRKKRDHVDEVLVQEMQAQESEWTNFDRDELIVKDRITKEILDLLLKDSAQVLKKTVQKKLALEQ